MNLPSTMTVEKLKEIKAIIFSAEVSFSHRPCKTPALNDLDLWIAELSPMEEPPKGNVILFDHKDCPAVAVHVAINNWRVTGFPHSLGWQEILAIDPAPKVIYRGEG